MAEFGTVLHSFMDYFDYPTVLICARCGEILISMEIFCIQERCNWNIEYSDKSKSHNSIIIFSPPTLTLILSENVLRFVVIVG